MKVILINILLFSWLFGLAQNKNLDSLKKVIASYKGRDTILVSMLYDFSSKAELIDADSALQYLTKEIKLAKELKWNAGLVKGMLLLGKLQYQANKLDEAVATAVQALKLSEEMHDQLLTANSNALLSESYRLIGDDKSAELYVKKYLELAISMKNDTAILKAMVLLSNLYSELGRWDEAEEIWPNALQLSDLQHDEISKVRLLEDLGARQVHLNNFAGALKYYKEILQVWEKRKNYHAVAWICVNLCQIFSEMHNRDSASYYGFSALKVAQDHNLKKETMNAYNALSNFFYEFNNYKQSLDYHLKFDSVYNITYTMEAARNAEKSRIEREQEKKDDSTKAVQDKKDVLAFAEIKNQKLVRNFSLSGAVTLLSLGSYSFYRYRRRRKLQSEQEMLNERLRISRELHDDMGSTLGSISIYSEVAKNRSQKNENAEEAISKIGIASRELIEKMSDIVWSINPNNESFEQLQNRMQAFAAMILTPRDVHYDFITDEEIKKLKLSAEQRKNIFLIFKEAVYNIVKYAECSKVEIKLSLHNDRFQMQIKDDGKGFDMAQNAETNNGTIGGNGLKNMKARAEDMNALFNIRSGISEGTAIELRFKV